MRWLSAIIVWVKVFIIFTLLLECGRGGGDNNIDTGVPAISVYAVCMV